MAQMTLLAMTQDILSELEEDEVNSINDSVVALQVANIIKTTYFNIIDSKDSWPWMRELFTLTGLADVTKPTHMLIPDTIIDVEFVKYNIRRVTDIKDKFTNITYKIPTDFLRLLEVRNSAATNVQVVTEVNGTKLNIRNDKVPQYWTSFDDTYIVFDSFDSAVDSVVQASKTQCSGGRYPTFSLTDNFVADLPIQMFTYLLNEAKSTSFLILKQMANQKAEQHSITQRRRMSQSAWKVAKGITYPNFGRKGKK